MAITVEKQRNVRQRTTSRSHRGRLVECCKYAQWYQNTSVSLINGHIKFHLTRFFSWKTNLISPSCLAGDPQKNVEWNAIRRGGEAQGAKPRSKGTVISDNYSRLKVTYSRQLHFDVVLECADTFYFYPDMVTRQEGARGLGSESDTIGRAGQNDVSRVEGETLWETRCEK